MEWTRPVVGCRGGRRWQGWNGVVIGELRRTVAGAGGQKRGRQEHGGKDRSGHWLISRDQLIALT